jgi:glucose/arabinose dehydrogenase
LENTHHEPHPHRRALAGLARRRRFGAAAWAGRRAASADRRGRRSATGHIERIVVNDKFDEMRREQMLTEMRQRVRDVRQGPDGFLYVLTEEDQAALLRIEPAP